ncbi:MAG: helix-turn-helix domain-containing protein, partial [Candidatus Bathyarchaeia archaeon]
MYHKEDVQTITKLGLTTSQVKVYLSLLQQKKATAKTISNFSKIARQEVYRVLSDLYEKGLVEKIIAKPTEFKAVPIEDCLK